MSDTEHLHRAVKLVQSGEYPFSELVTHKLPLAKATEALHLVKKRETMKAVLVPD